MLLSFNGEQPTAYASVKATDRHSMLQEYSLPWLALSIRRPAAIGVGEDARVQRRSPKIDRK
jgi:hypothetical protein